MLTISEIQDKMDKTINYINSIKYYSEGLADKVPKEEERQDIIKYMIMCIDNLYYVFRSLAKLHSSYESSDNLELVLDVLKDSYIISDKCVRKVMYIDSNYKEVEKGDKINFNILLKIVEYVDDIIDELLSYLAY